MAKKSNGGQMSYQKIETVSLYLRLVPHVNSLSMLLHNSDDTLRT